MTSSESGSRLESGVGDPAVTRPRIGDLTSHLTCVLCRGFFIDATVVVECLHTFCRSCILRHLEAYSFCPVCNVKVQKSKGCCSLRSDSTIQRLVYKMIPSLHEAEMSKRRHFYDEKPYADPELPAWAKGDVTEYVPHVYVPHEPVHVRLHLYNSDGAEAAGSVSMATPQDRYLRCPAGTPLTVLQKLLKNKLQLCSPLATVQLIHKDDVLPEDISLLDLIYMYGLPHAEMIALGYRLARKRCSDFTIEEGAAVSKRARLCPDVQVTDLCSAELETNSRSEDVPPMFDADDEEPTSPEVVEDIIATLDAEDSAPPSPVDSGVAASTSSEDAQEDETACAEDSMDVGNVDVCIESDGDGVAAVVEEGSFVVADSVESSLVRSSSVGSNLQPSTDELEIGSHEVEGDVESDSSTGPSIVSSRPSHQVTVPGLALGDCDSDSDSEPDGLVVDESFDCDDDQLLGESAETSGDSGVCDGAKPSSTEDLHRHQMEDNDVCVSSGVCQTESSKLHGDQKKAIRAETLVISEGCSDRNVTPRAIEDSLIADVPRSRSAAVAGREVTIEKKLNICTVVSTVSCSTESHPTAATECSSSRPDQVDCSVQTSLPENVSKQLKEVNSSVSRRMSEASTGTVCKPSQVHGPLNNCVPDKTKKQADSSTGSPTPSDDAPLSRSPVYSDSSQIKVSSVASINKKMELHAPETRDAVRVSSFNVRSLIGSTQGYKNEAVANHLKNVKRDSCVEPKADKRVQAVCNGRPSQAAGAPCALDLSTNLRKAADSTSALAKTPSPPPKRSKATSKSKSSGRAQGTQTIHSIVNSLANRQHISLTPIPNTTNKSYRKPATSCASSSPSIQIPRPPSSLPASSPVPLPPYIPPYLPDPRSFPSSYSRLISAPPSMSADMAVRVEYDLAMRNLMAISHMQVAMAQQGGSMTKSMSPSYPALHYGAQSYHHHHHHSETAAHLIQQHQRQFEAVLKTKSSPLAGCTAPKVRSPPGATSASIQRIQDLTRTLGKSSSKKHVKSVKKC